MNILMIVENNYPQDIRVRKEAEALTEGGHSVIVIALRDAEQKAYEEIRGVRTYRIPEITLFEKTKRANANYFVKVYEIMTSVTGYVLEYAYFTVASFLVSMFILLRHGFDVIHTHNPPDTLSLIGIFYKALGKKYVFDHHDLSPELYLSRVSGKRDLIYRGLLFFERLSCSYSDVLISTNESYRRIEMRRHAADPGKIFVVRNNPLLGDCVGDGGRSEHAGTTDRRKVVLFLGSINPQDGVDVLLQAVHHLVHELKRKDFLCRIVGGGDHLDSVKRMTRELNITEYVELTGRIMERERVKQYLAGADIGVEPAPLNDVNRYSTFIKVMEYMAAGKPVVAFDLEETRYSAIGSALLVEPGNVAEFARAIEALLDAPQLREELGRAGRERIEKELNWKQAASNLTGAYATLSGAVRSDTAVSSRIR